MPRAMKLRIDASIKLWIDAECDHMRVSGDVRPLRERRAESLLAWEQEGAAMRYLDASGKIAWKPSPRMIEHWKDLEADAEADWPDCF